MRVKICGLLLLNVIRIVSNLVYLIPGKGFVLNGLKGQANTLHYWYHEVPIYDCTYHIKENMKKHKNGNATKQETECFDKYVFSENLTTAAINKTELLTLVNSRTR